MNRFWVITYSANGKLHNTMQQFNLCWDGKFGVVNAINAQGQEPLLVFPSLSPSLVPETWDDGKSIRLHSFCHHLLKGFGPLLPWR